MTTGAIIMMVLGLGLTWGGAAICIIRAMSKQSQKN
ncbi:MetS family NSS transporter small subunit [Vibrio pectenicida]|uniref:MetS family NSS transporter small subunit n=1 Tax=Vibrio pectenicida TaxID=62763 RepID=A0A3R9FYB3_9VIBR|nr:MetS family NSS transporter small subunit [Vibrio pectenicida]NOH70946.1 MetS family NSS transporter small subunit [Vibrio pectenicida]RSD27922.1 MetS family NSS transporter small subunit [Vibrio pectenicida]